MCWSIPSIDPWLTLNQHNFQFTVRQESTNLRLMHVTQLDTRCTLDRLLIKLWVSTEGAFLWEDPDQDFRSVAFLSSVSFFRSLIYRIHSGQGFIGSLIWVICKRIIGSMIRRVPLVEGFEINHCAQQFWPWITYLLHIWDPLRRSVDSIWVLVSGLLKFKPVSACYWVKVRNSAKCQWNTNIWMGWAKLCFGFTTKLSYNSRILVHATFKMASLVSYHCLRCYYWFYSFVVATPCYFAVRFGCSNAFRACCHGNWSYELKFRSFGTPWSERSWIRNPDPDSPKGTHPEYQLGCPSSVNQDFDWVSITGRFRVLIDDQPQMHIANMIYFLPIYFVNSFWRKPKTNLNC